MGWGGGRIVCLKVLKKRKLAGNFSPYGHSHCVVCTDSNISVRVSKINETKSHSITSLYNVKQQANITATGNIDLGVLAFLVF